MPTACDRRVDPPAAVAAMKRLRLGILHACDGADNALREQILDQKKTRQATTIIGDKQREARRCECLNHCVAFLRVPCHGFLDVRRLARSSDLQGTLEVRFGWSCDIYCVNVPLRDECIHIIVPPWNTMALRVISRSSAVASHHGHKLRVARFLECGAAFNLGDIAASDN